MTIRGRLAAQIPQAAAVAEPQQDQVAEAVVPKPVRLVLIQVVTPVAVVPQQVALVLADQEQVVLGLVVLGLAALALVVRATIVSRGATHAEIVCPKIVALSPPIARMTQIVKMGQFALGLPAKARTKSALRSATPMVMPPLLPTHNARWQTAATLFASNESVNS